MKIVYMGTPGFAVEPLRCLLAAGHQILAVVTAPDKPAGRGQSLHQSEVKLFALEQNLNVLQPVKLRDESFLATLKALEADLFVVVAFRMLPDVVWEMPPKGTINLHASLLPQYRGAAPINWSIINGETETGVTTFFITHEIDTGALLLQSKVAIGPDETAGELHDKLMFTGAELLVKTVADIAVGSIDPQPQVTSDRLKHAPKLFKDQCRIDWQHTALQIHNLVRGLSPYPTAWTEMWCGKETVSVKLFATLPEAQSHDLVYGTIDTDRKTYLKVACEGGFVYINELQVQGKKRLPIKVFLAGFRFADHYQFR